MSSIRVLAFANNSSSGNGQIGNQGFPLPLPLVVKATLNAAPASGIVVTFTDNGAGGSFGTNPSTTGGDGLATTTYTPPINVPGPYYINYSAPTYLAPGFFVENAVTNRTGKAISLGSQVTIPAKVVSVSGAGALATVTVQAPQDSGTIQIQANDAHAVQQPDGAAHLATSIDGKFYGASGDDVTAIGVVTAAFGLGNSAIVSVLLANSQTTIQTAAGNCITS